MLFGLVATGFAEHANGGRRSVEDIHIEALRDAPGAAGVRELRHTFIENTRSGEGQRAVDDIGVAGDPADISHAPVDIFGVNVLIKLGSAGDVSEVTASPVLAALGFAGGAAGVHEEKRILGIHRNGLDDTVPIILEDIVDKIIALENHGRIGSVAVGIAFPDENLVDALTFLLGGFDSEVGAGLVVYPAAVAVVAIGVNQNAAAGIGGAKATGFSGEAAEDDGMDDAESGASEHGDGQLGDHGHVNGDAITLLQAGKVAEHGGHFVDAAVELLEGDDDVVFVLRFRNEDERGLVLPFCQVTIHAVVAGVELAAHKPLPEGRMFGVERGVPVLIPVEKFGVFAEALGKILFAEAFNGVRIVQVGLSDEAGRRPNIFFFLPMDRNLGFRQGWPLGARFPLTLLFLEGFRHGILSIEVRKSYGQVRTPGAARCFGEARRRGTSVGSKARVRMMLLPEFPRQLVGWRWGARKPGGVRELQGRKLRLTEHHPSYCFDTKKVV